MTFIDQQPARRRAKGAAGKNHTRAKTRARQAVGGPDASGECRPAERSARAWHGPSPTTVRRDRDCDQSYILLAGERAGGSRELICSMGGGVHGHRFRMVYTAQSFRGAHILNNKCGAGGKSFAQPFLWRSLECVTALQIHFALSMWKPSTIGNVPRLLLGLLSSAYLSPERCLCAQCSGQKNNRLQLRGT